MQTIWIVFLQYPGIKNEPRFSAAFTNEQAAKDYACRGPNAYVKETVVYDSADSVE